MESLELESVEFNPKELLELKEMDERELRKLMMLCGIRVHNGMPVVAMNEEEMRTAYLAWKFTKIQEHYRTIQTKAERGLNWWHHLRQAIWVATEQ